MIEIAEQEFNIDAEKIIIVGESNGGMMAYYLAGKTKARYYMPVYGSPPFGSYPSVKKEDALFNFFDRSDDLVPLDGGVNREGNVYTSDQEQIDHWSEAQDCDISEPMEVIETPRSGGIYNVES